MLIDQVIQTSAKRTADPPAFICPTSGSILSPGWRRLTREEAKQIIARRDFYVLNAPYMLKYDLLIHRIVEKVLHCTGKYFASARSAFTDFICDLVIGQYDRKNERPFYKALASGIHKEFGVPICSVCLAEARYCWRIADLLQQHLEHVRHRN